MQHQPRDQARLKPATDWTAAKPEHMPLPTVWPATLALASTLLVWGFISSWIITAVGVALFIVSTGGWIADIRHERATQ